MWSEAKVKTIETMVSMANELVRNKYSDNAYDLNNKIWEMALDFNHEHDDEEIFMCEHVNDETGLVDGFYIEDDYWITSID